MITKRLVGCGLAALMALCGTVAAQQPSDLLRIKVSTAGNDKLGAQISLQAGKGANIQNAILGTSTDLYDLLNNAGVESFTETPIFDPVDFPDGALEHRLVFAPVTIAKGQEFFGLVGFGGEPGEPGYTEDFFRNELCRDFEVEVDGVAVRAEAFELAPQFPVETDHGTEVVTIFNYTQKLLTKGTHHVVYRLTNMKTRGDCAIDCFPAGKWIFYCTINVTAGGAASKASVSNAISFGHFPCVPKGAPRPVGSEQR